MELRIFIKKIIPFGIKVSQTYLYVNLRTREMEGKRMELACLHCNRTYELRPQSNCEVCFYYLNPRYDLKDKAGLKRIIEEGKLNMFRYFPLLPVSEQIESDVGFTPLVRADDLAEFLGILPGKLYVKFDEGPVTQSFKERGVAVTRQIVEGYNIKGNAYESFGANSTGNLASATAAGAASIGLKSIILVHKDAEDRLLQKALSFGAYVLKVNDNYREVNLLTGRVIAENDSLNSRIAWINLTFRPLYSQGAKTIGFEIAEQLGWKAPDNIVHPVAAGLSLWQIYNGLKEFSQFGVVPSLQTRMHAVQTKACDPLVQAWEKGEPFEIIPMKPRYKSIAETLSVGEPGNGLQALNTLKESKGSANSLNEDEIEVGMQLISKHTDWKTGPVGGVVVAGLKNLLSKRVIKPDELTVLVLTDAYRSEDNCYGPYAVSQTSRLIHLEPNKKLINNTLEQILANKI